MKHTNNEQMKFLISHGVDINTSDLSLNEGIPSWSTDALLNLLPMSFVKNNTKYFFFLKKEEIKDENWKCGYTSECDNTNIFLIEKSDLFDVVYLTLKWYLENI